MRQLFPSPIDEVDPLDLYLADDRPTPAGRPWVMLNMIASIDGATAVDGLSGALGGPGDEAVFAAIRASCDWILVASATAKAEAYRIPRATPDIMARRTAAGRTPVPRLAIVTASGRVDPAIPALAERDDGDDPPVVITGTAADHTALSALDAEIVRLGDARPSPASVLEELHRHGAAVVLAEGGPSWNGHLVTAGVVDELCLSISPMLVGGGSARIVAGADDAVATGMRLDRLLEQDDLVFARYVRA